MLVQSSNDADLIVRALIELATDPGLDVETAFKAALLAAKIAHQHIPSCTRSYEY